MILCPVLDVSFQLDWLTTLILL